jgi:hypothetical protein
MIDHDPPTVPSYHLFSQPTDPAAQAARSRAWAGDEFSFHDLIDTINPLQHLPVVSTVYRWLTGDTIGNVPRIAGDAIYGGPLGLVSGLFNAALKQESGEDLGEHVVAMFTGSDGTATAVASASGDKPNAATAAVASNNAVAAADSGGAATPAQSTASTAASGLPLTSARSAAAADSDPRVAFLAQGDAVRRLPGAQTSRPLNNRPVPLQGYGLPPGFAVPKPQASGVAAGGPATQSDETLQAANTVSATAPTGRRPTNLLPSKYSPAGLPPTGLAPNGQPSNPSTEISQQMLDALDKYLKMRQQRGTQLDIAQ